MTRSIAHRIHLAGDYRPIEAVAASAITPGMLLYMNSDGKFAAHAVDDGHAERLFALEDALQGAVVGTAYAADDRVSAALEMPGSEVNALLGGGYSYTVGDRLTSAGDGTLIPATAMDSAIESEQVIAICLETVDLSDTATNDALVPVRLF